MEGGGRTGGWRHQPGGGSTIRNALHAGRQRRRRVARRPATENRRLVRRYSAVAWLARIKIRNIRNCQLEHYLAAIRPRVLGKASQPAQKVRGSSTVRS